MPSFPAALRSRKTSLVALGVPLVTAVVLVDCTRSSSGTSRVTGGAGARPGEGAPEAPLDGGARPLDVTSTEADETADEVPTIPAVQLLGRFDTRDTLGPRCAWPGCRIIARFEGTSVSARLKELDEPWMEGAPSEWDVALDGALLPKLVMSRGERDYVLATDLAPGAHEVELYKRTEAQNGVTQFLGYDFGDGTLLPPPARRRRRIEVISDSSAAGFGVEGVGQGPDCPGPDWGAEWQNFHKSLSVLLADALDAELAGTAYSGKGIAQNISTDDTETMPILFPRALPNDPSSTWDFGSFIPDVVVIMMGGNDFALGQPVDRGPATLEEFTDAYEAFTVTLRDRYANAQLFLVTSPSVSDAEPAGRNTRTNVLAGIGEVVARRKRAGDAKVHAVEPPVAPRSELTGCNGHGSPEFHRRVANDLAPVIRATMRW